MKTLLLASLAAPAAFVALPINFTTLVSALFATGLTAMLFADYGRRSRPLLATTATAPINALASQRSERLGLAA
jgi:hypothetical protein